MMNVLRRATLLLAVAVGLSVPIVPAAHASENGIKTNLTWSVSEQSNGYVHIGADGQSDPYSGDTTIDQYRPALCLQVDGRPAPGGIAFDFYNGWSQGEVRATARVRGDALTSRAVADGLCASTFGSGWRLAEFHDGRYGSDFSQTGGWSFWAAGGNFLPGDRFWVAINDQPANAWDSAGLWPDPIAASPQNDLILRTHLTSLVLPLLRTAGNTSFQALVRNLAAQQFDGDSNALMSEVITSAEESSIVDPNSADWLAFKAGVAQFGSGDRPQILIPNQEDGLITTDSVTMVVAGAEGQNALPAYTFDGSDVVAAAPVDEAYSETHEVWVLSINEGTQSTGSAAAAAPMAGPRLARQQVKAMGTMGTLAVCNPTGLRNNRGLEYLNDWKIPNPNSVEHWWQGKLEVRLVVVGKGGAEIKNAFWKYKHKSVRNGITTDMFMTTWDRAQWGDYWAYKWVEEDSGPTVGVSLGLGGWITQLLGVPITLDITATIAPQNDDMGAGVVGFTESTYLTYSTGTVEWHVCSVGGDGGTGNDNFARQATVAASSTFSGYSPARVNDGDRNTSLGGAYSWANNYTYYPPSTPQWVQLDFGVNKTFSRVVIYTSSGYPIRDFDIQVWNGVTWVTPAGAMIRNNTALQVTVTFGARTSRLVRVLGYSGPTHQPGYVRVNEFEVYA